MTEKQSSVPEVTETQIGIAPGKAVMLEDDIVLGIVLETEAGKFQALATPSAIAQEPCESMDSAVTELIRFATGGAEVKLGAAQVPSGLIIPGGVQ